MKYIRIKGRIYKEVDDNQLENSLKRQFESFVKDAQREMKSEGFQVTLSTTFKSLSNGGSQGDVILSLKKNSVGEARSAIRGLNWSKTAEILKERVNKLMAVPFVKKRWKISFNVAGHRFWELSGKGPWRIAYLIFEPNESESFKGMGTGHSSRSYPMSEERKEYASQDSLLEMGRCIKVDSSFAQSANRAGRISVPLVKEGKRLVEQIQNWHRKIEKTLESRGLPYSKI